MVPQQKSKKHAAPSRGCASDQFPGKLHDLMTHTEQAGLSDIISWVQNGQAIMVHDSERLLKILPLFGFSQTKYRSFQRQL
jgi:tRNA1(Val) A37 N6-methylase TrmN6